MEHKIKLEELNKEALSKLEDYMKEKGSTGNEQHDVVHAAKNDWQAEWNKLMETLVVLEKLEI